MELFLQILLCLFFIALVVIGEIYLEMDKQKARAGTYVGKMKEYLDAWVKCTAELANRPGLEAQSAHRIGELASSYFGSKKYKETFIRISLVNAMAVLSDQMALSRDPEALNAHILRERTVAAASLAGIRTYYNQCIKKLNGRLNKRIPAAVGKLFRLHRLDELCDLSAA